MKAIGLSTTHTCEQLLEAGAHHVVADFASLMDLSSFPRGSRKGAAVAGR